MRERSAAKSGWEQWEGVECHGEKLPDEDEQAAAKMSLANFTTRSTGL